MERFIGDLVDHFAIIRIKFCHSWTEIETIIKTCMALMNIDAHEDITQQQIFQISTDEWEELMHNNSKWLDGSVICPIENEVVYIKLI